MISPTCAKKRRRLGGDRLPGPRGYLRDFVFFFSNGDLTAQKWNPLNSTTKEQNKKSCSLEGGEIKQGKVLSSCRDDLLSTTGYGSKTNQKR